MQHEKQDVTPKTETKVQQKRNSTTRKTKVVGTETFVNQATGELQDMQVISIEDRDFNFTKVWMMNIINSIELIGNQKTRLAFWIIENLNRENQLVMTQRQIAEKTGISVKTVSITMKALQEANFLRKINGGAYCVNPDVLFKGTRNNRMNVLLQYSKLDEAAADPQPDAEPQQQPKPKKKAQPKKSAVPAKPKEVEPDEMPVELLTCPECGEDVEPHPYRDKRPGHEREIHYECPKCQADLDFLKGAASA